MTPKIEYLDAVISRNEFRKDFPTSTIKATKTPKSVLIDPKRLEAIKSMITDCQISKICPAPTK